MKKKEIVKVPRKVILVVARKVVGYVPNSEKVIKSLHLPFKLDLTNTDVLMYSFADLDKVKMDNLQAIIVDTTEKPAEVINWFLVRNLDPLLHYTANAYKVMSEEEKENWRGMEAGKKLSPATYKP